MRKAEAVQTRLVADQQLAQIIRIGTETVLSQFPIHKLSKGKEPLEIQFTKTDQRGKVTTIWKVSPSRDYGEPGILAYRIDTLIINRLIDQSRPDVPEVIRLGSLRDICQQLGITEGKNTKLIKDALYQNAFAGITAKLEYNGRDKQRRTFEFGSTRYSVVFTGERLPDGKRADAVYVILNTLFRELLRYANTRPLDYNYLRSLKPSTQRLYELISPQVFAAIKRGNGRAKYYYSDFCKYAPLTRFFDWNQVRPQMHRIHKEHLASGYINKVDFEKTRDEQGHLDWVMLYTPGKRAQAEFEAFNKDRDDGTRTPERTGPRLLMPSETLDLDEKERSLFDQLRHHGVREDLAYRLVKDDQGEVEKQLEAFPNWKLDGIENPAGFLIASIRNKYAVPQSVHDAGAKALAKRRAEAKAKRREEARQKLHKEFSPEYLNTYLRPIRDRLKEINVEAFDAYQARCERMNDFLSADGEDHELWKLWDLEEMSKSWPELKILTFWDWMEESHSYLLVGLNG
jgi:hypothetical protein